jgi:rSAM/selenodomain-associated transferase 1
MSSPPTARETTARASGNVLLVFVKYPAPGIVKTRLVPKLTPEQAAALCRAMTEDTLRTTRRSHSYQTTVCFAPASAYREVRSWLGPDVSLQGQCEGDLGARQYDAIRRALEAGFGKAVIIGSDCPTIAASDIETALQALDDADVVIGPAEDGGYYLIGARCPVRSIFEGISWSTEKVLGETTARVEEAGLTFELLDVKSDIDSYDDLERYYVSVKDRPGDEPASRGLEVIHSILDGRRS